MNVPCGTFISIYSLVLIRQDAATETGEAAIFFEKSNGHQDFVVGEQGLSDGGRDPSIPGVGSGATGAHLVDSFEEHRRCGFYIAGCANGAGQFSPGRDPFPDQPEFGAIGPGISRG